MWILRLTGLMNFGFIFSHISRLPLSQRLDEVKKLLLLCEQLYQVLAPGQAQAYCKGLGEELVKINSEEENGFVLKLVHKRAPSVKQVWIGLRWNACVRGFIWSDLSILKYTSWAPLEPNGKAREPCGNMLTGRTTNLPFHAPGYWNDCNCQTLVHTLCGLVCKSFAEPDCDGKVNPDTSERCCYIRM